MGRPGTWRLRHLDVSADQAACVDGVERCENGRSSKMWSLAWES